MKVRVLTGLERILAEGPESFEVWIINSSSTPDEHHRLECEARAKHILEGWLTTNGFVRLIGEHYRGGNGEVAVQVKDARRSSSQHSESQIGLHPRYNGQLARVLQEVVVVQCCDPSAPIQQVADHAIVLQSQAPNGIGKPTTELA
jgi:hypothetical protein